VLHPDRRGALVAWARRNDALILEDDYDAEYRYDRHPVGALHGLAPDRVVYCGSVSKTLSPALRLGWAVIPPRLRAVVTAARERSDLGTPTLDQPALARFIAHSEYDRHLRRLRAESRRRRDALVAALDEHLTAPRIGGVATGLHIVLAIDGDEQAARTAAEAAGVGPRRHGRAPHRHRTRTRAYPRLRAPRRTHAPRRRRRARGGGLQPSALSRRPQVGLPQSAASVLVWDPPGNTRPAHRGAHRFLSMEAASPVLGAAS
jgi:GntR family transcriptional regulator/MocR family aminotransferase